MLSLFGWIYLQSGEDKYIEKSMQVFKKAAKLSLPNFDIAVSVTHRCSTTANSDHSLAPVATA